MYKEAYESFLKLAQGDSTLAEKVAEHILDGLSDDQVNALGYVSGGTAIGGGLLAKKQFDRGNITGRETLWHATSKKNVPSILEQGLLGSKANDPETYTNKNLGHIKANSPDSMEDLVYLGRKKMSAFGVGMQRQMLMGEPQTILKANAPTWKMTEVTNPELYGETDPYKIGEKAYRARFGDEGFEFAKSLGEDNFNKAIRKLGINIKKSLGPEGTATIKGDISPEYIKGSGKKGYYASPGEIVDFIRHNPERFAKGLGLASLGAALTGAGAYGAYEVNKESNKRK